MAKFEAFRRVISSSRNLLFLKSVLLLLLQLCVVVKKSAKSVQLDDFVPHFCFVSKYYLLCEIENQGQENMVLENVRNRQTPLHSKKCQHFYQNVKNCWKYSSFEKKIQIRDNFIRKIASYHVLMYMRHKQCSKIEKSPIFKLGGYTDYLKG